MICSEKFLPLLLQLQSTRWVAEMFISPFLFPWGYQRLKLPLGAFLAFVYVSQQFPLPLLSTQVTSILLLSDSVEMCDLDRKDTQLHSKMTHIHFSIWKNLGSSRTCLVFILWIRILFPETKDSDVSFSNLIICPSPAFSQQFFATWFQNEIYEFCILVRAGRKE